MARIYKILTIMFVALLLGFTVVSAYLKIIPTSNDTTDGETIAYTTDGETIAYTGDPCTGDTCGTGICGPGTRNCYNNPTGGSYRRECRNTVKGGQWYLLDACGGTTKCSMTKSSKVGVESIPKCA